MLLIFDIVNNKIVKNCGTNSCFPDGNIPNIELKENEVAVRVHDLSPEAKQIIEACEYNIVPKFQEIYETKEIYETDEEGNEILVGTEQIIKDSYYIIDMLEIIKTKEDFEKERIPSEAEINNKVVQKIREKYDINEEFKMQRLGIEDKDNTDYLTYLAHVQICRTWGQQEKIKYDYI